MFDPKTLIQERLARSSWGVLGTRGYILGIDLGSYGLRAALIDLHNHSYSSAQVDIRDYTPQNVVEDSIMLARTLLADNDVPPDRLVRIGVGFSGPVDPIRGKTRLSTRVRGWEDYPVKERFEQAFDTVTLLENDANLIALGEATFGIGHGCDHLFYMHLSSGVGGGMVLNGELYHGATAMAGEIGHAVVGHGWDGVGQPLMLEAFLSIDGLTQRARALGLDTSNLNDIFSDHSVGIQVITETVKLLAMRLAQIVALLDPQMIVLGGIVVRIGGDAFVQAVEQQMHQFIAPEFKRPVQVVASALEFDSVAIGALALAAKSLQA